MTSQREALFAIAHALGHTDPTVWETRGGDFFCSCACGWESTNRALFVDALGAGVHHALSIAQPIARRARASGRPVGAVIASELRKPPEPRPKRENDPRLAERRLRASRVA